MRHFNLKIIIAILVANFALVSCNSTSKSDNKEKALIEKENDLLKEEQELNQKNKAKSDNSTVKQSENSTSDNLDFLKTLNEKYPYEAKLFDNPALTQRLKKLLGRSRYNFLKETWSVETPMKFENNIFVASGCQAHNCYSTNFIIVFDFSKNVMYAGIREENNVKTYSEDGSSSPIVNKWKNRT